jgi:hypothetical protein
MNKTQQARRERLMPNGIPRYIRIYDNGGESADRYTCVYSGHYNNIGKSVRGIHANKAYHYVAMSEAPYSHCGIGLHGSTEWHCCDVNKSGFAPAIGRKNHLGKRISFSELPEDCKKLVVDDYKDIWEIK